jgi:hypothetical protein
VQIGLREEAKKRIGTEQVHACDGVDEPGFVLDRGNACQFGFQRRKAFCVCCFFVHA